MKDTYVKVVGQKACAPEGDKYILVMVVPTEAMFRGYDDLLPEIFEAQAVIPAPTIYSGVTPKLSVIPESIEDVFEDRRGSGIASIVTNTDWYCVERERIDPLGIGLSEKDLTKN